MTLREPLSPKKPDGILHVLLPGRVSTTRQDLESIASQHQDAGAWLRREYAGPCAVTELGEQASGWLTDRPTMLRARAVIEAGDCDLVLVGELREISRNPGHQWAFVQHCLDHDTRVICLADGIDTADESWETMMHTAVMRHGMFVPDTRRRVRRKATHSFGQGGMVLKVKFGYRKLTKEEAAAGMFGPVGLRIAKVDAATATIREMRTQVLGGTSREAVADWLTAGGIDPGPYAGGGWTGRLVTDLLTDPILSGRRQFRKVISQIVYKTGKHKARPNPKAAESETCPSLAHLTVAEHEELLAYLAERKQNHRTAQASGRASPLWNVPRSRTLWPGQAVRCGACHGLMYRYGDYLKCRNALAGGSRTCWNHVLVDLALVHARVLPVVVRFLDRDPRVRARIAAAAWQEYQRACRLRQQTAGDLDRQIADMDGQRKNLAKAIAKNGPLDSLVSLLTEVEEKLTTARAAWERTAASEGSIGSIRSAADVEARFEETLVHLAAGSREFAEILRRLIPEFVIRPVQALDCQLVRPRAELTVSTGFWAPSGGATTEESLTLDLFDPPAHIASLAACEAAGRTHPGAGLRTLARHLDIGYMTVKRARKYALRMQQAGTPDPYRVLTEPPAQASRWRSRGRGQAGSPARPEDPEVA